MTLDQLITSLQLIRDTSPFKGNDVVYLCLEDSEIEYMNVKHVFLNGDTTSGVVLICADNPLPNHARIDSTQ